MKSKCTAIIGYTNIVIRPRTREEFLPYPTLLRVHVKYLVY